MLLPLVRMWERVEVGRADSDTTLFTYLMYAGELALKFAVAGIVAAVENERERLRYQQLHKLVRADGIGEWVASADEILTGPPAQHLLTEARAEVRELTQKCPAGQWQHDAASHLQRCLQLLQPEVEELPAKVDGRHWLRLFAQLRNKTRGHGAPKGNIVSQLCGPLEESLRLFTGHFCLFHRQWAYLHRNLSGKYRVTRLSADASAFDEMKRKPTKVLPDGVYVYFGKPVHVELSSSSVDADDFYFANGGFNGKRLEMLSYLTGATFHLDATPYLNPPGTLPPSETSAISELEADGQSFTNLPLLPGDYVQRVPLEADFRALLSDEHHPIITLIGRGGIGKTYLALAVLHEIKKSDRFSLIVWFSARDIDLLLPGAKSVRPDVVTLENIATSFAEIVGAPVVREKSRKKHLEYLSSNLTNSDIGPTLFVFDNFETVNSPIDIFGFIDTYVRPPNKVLITTRFRDFKGDYPLEVPGMTEEECQQLIARTAPRLGVQGLLTPGYLSEFIAESEGHPYVIKILLGELAKAGQRKKIERIIADREDILLALFERTYRNLSRPAERVFLTLCGWQATVPLVALEAVLLRSENERIDVQSAVQELERSSFIDVVKSAADDQFFLAVPLTARLFGRSKLYVSALKSAIEVDLEWLLLFGAGRRTDVRHGINPRIKRLVGAIARKISQGQATLEGHRPMLEFLARKYPPAWLNIADLYEDAESEANLREAKRAVQSFLEAVGFAQMAVGWRRLAALCMRTGDVMGEVHALVEMAELTDVPFGDVSGAANRFNELLRARKLEIDSEEKRVLAGRLARTMEVRIQEADATDLSRLAWLYLHLQDEERAKRSVQRGLERDAWNEHCFRLAERLRLA